MARPGIDPNRPAGNAAQKGGGMCLPLRQTGMRLPGANQREEPAS